MALQAVAAAFFEANNAKAIVVKTSR